MIFHHKQRNIENLIPQLNLNEQIIEQATDFSFWGLTIDQHMTWGRHVKNIKQYIKITRDYVQIKIEFLPKIYPESSITA